MLTAPNSGLLTYRRLQTRPHAKHPVTLTAARNQKPADLQLRPVLRKSVTRIKYDLGHLWFPEPEKLRLLLLFFFFFKLQKNVADRQAISNTWHPVTSSGKGRGGRVCTIFFVLLQGAWRKDVNGGEPLATANRKPLDSAVCGFATIKVIRELIHLAGQGWSQWFSSYSSLRSLSMSQSEIRGPRCPQ